MAAVTEAGIRAVFAANLRRERKARGWTQEELGRKSGVTGRTVLRAEKGSDGVTLGTAAMLAGGLGMKLADLITGDGETGHG